jgi:hypothetical protein
VFAVKSFQFPFQGLEKGFGTGEGLNSSPSGSCSGEPKDKVRPAVRKSF